MQGNSLSSHLDKLFKLLVINHSPLVELLKPGISTAQIQKESQKLGLPFSDQLSQMYNWKNGVEIEEKSLGIYYLFRLGIYYDLEKATCLYLGLNDTDVYWKKSMFPLFGSGGGEFFLIDLDVNSNTYESIILYYPGNPDFEVTIMIYDSLESLIRTIIECYEKKAYSVIEEKFKHLKIDSKLEKEIAMRNNPKSPYWNFFV